MKNRNRFFEFRILSYDLTSYLIPETTDPAYPQDEEYMINLRIPKTDAL